MVSNQLSNLSGCQFKNALPGQFCGPAWLEFAKEVGRQWFSPTIWGYFSLYNVITSNKSKACNIAVLRSDTKEG